MKVKTVQRFRDLKENEVREVGDEFIVSKERFEELSAAGELIAEVEEVEVDVIRERKKRTKNNK